MGAIVILIYFLFPALILYLATRLSIINKIGIVVICYIFGLVLGNVNIIPESISDFQGTLMGATILLGIPLVLFSENVVKWARMARTTFVSLLLGVVSVVVLVFAGYFVFRERIPEIWKISGMMIGVYTGGTPNLAAIARGLNVDEDLYILTHTVELAVGALVLLFLITGAKPFFSLFMKPYRRDDRFNEKEAALTVSDFESYTGFFSRSNLPGLAKALGITLVIFGLSYGLSLLFEGDARDTAAILAVTTLGILASLVPGINRIKKSFQLGMYFIYMFCVIVASKADLRALFAPESFELMINIFFLFHPVTICIQSGRSCFQINIENDGQIRPASLQRPFSKFNNFFHPETTRITLVCTCARQPPVKDYTHTCLKGRRHLFRPKLCPGRHIQKQLRTRTHCGVVRIEKNLPNFLADNCRTRVAKS